MMVVIAVDLMSLNSIVLIVTVSVSTKLKSGFPQMYLVYSQVPIKQVGPNKRVG